MKIFIAHSGWSVERRGTLRRLLGQLQLTHLNSQGLDVEVVTSKEKEHSSVWSDRLWEACSKHDGDAVCLNDDVEVCPRFPAVVEAMLSQADAEVVSMHTNMAVAPSLAEAGQRFLKSYFVTGPAYVLRRGVARRLNRFARRLPAGFRAGTQEDNVAILWTYHEREPAWATIPSLVKHDVSVPSTCGYDDHPLRRALVPWDLPVFLEDEPYGCSNEDGSKTRNLQRQVFGVPPLADPGFWAQKTEPAYVECSWMPTQTMRSYEMMWGIGVKPGDCWACGKERGMVGVERIGMMVCSGCALSLGYSAGQGLQDFRTKVIANAQAAAAAAKNGPRLVSPAATPIPNDVLTRR